MYFKLKKGAGSHTQPDQNGELKVYTADGGEVIKSDIDLCEKFPNKFERIDIGTDSVIVDEPEENEDVVTEQKEEEERKPIGKDCTAKFLIAQEQDFKVFYKRGKGYFVTEADDEFTPLNKKGLKKDDVEDFIIEYLEE